MSKIWHNHIKACSWAYKISQWVHEGNKINHEGLLKYIVSFRNHNDFHEQCLERIYDDIMYYCKPKTQQTRSGNKPESKLDEGDGCGCILYASVTIGTVTAQRSL